MGRRYREMEVMTATPEMLVVRLYEGAIRQSRLALEHLGAGRIHERGVALSKVLAIVGELQGCLDFERGGEIARNLDALYVFVSDRLLEANLRGSGAPIEESIRVLETLLSAWVEIARGPRIAAAAATAAAAR